MRTFDPRTATEAEFEAEARRLHAGRLARIESMTPEEHQACAKFMIDGYFQRAATLRLNELWGPEDMDIQIAKCVEIWRTDNFQNSAEYAAERDRLIEADRARKEAEASERARQEAARRNARARWIAQGNDPSLLPPEGGEEAVDLAREPETALVFEQWKALGRPNVLSVPGRAPVKFRYPAGATDVEMWDFYITKRDFLQSGHSWNSPEGRRLGEEHNAVERRIEQAVRDRAEAEAFAAEAPADMSDDEVLAGIDGAIEFHRTKTRLQRNIDQWNAIREAIVSGKASGALKARVERAAAGARPGAKYYDLWMAVRDRVRELPTS